MTDKQLRVVFILAAVLTIAWVCPRANTYWRERAFLDDCTAANAQAGQRAFPLCYLELLKAQQPQVQVVFPTPVAPPEARKPVALPETPSRKP
jgi:hypothetical protein